MLRLSKLQAHYGKSQVLRGVDLDVGAGQIIALLGRNGSGRSTLAKAVMGMVQCSGSVYLNGEQVCGLPSYQIAQKGLGYVPEERAIFPSLTVRQNLELGRKPAPRATRWDIDDMYRWFPQLRARQSTVAGLLSGGEQQMLTLCRTLMGDPDVIIVDEPTEGIAPKIVQEIAALLQEIAQRGVAVLLIEQKLDIALKICDRLYVMGHGSVVFEGTAAELHERGDIRGEWLAV